MTRLAPLTTIPHSLARSKSYLINITRDTLIPLITGNAKVLETLCQKWEQYQIYTVDPALIHSFTFHGFSYMQSTEIQSIRWKIPEINNLSFKLFAALISVRKSHVRSLHSTQEMNHSFVQHILPPSL